MYNEYGDYYDEEYYEPSKIEQAYQEFLDKAKECMKEDLAQQAKQIEEDKNRVSNREEELAVKERELNEREYQINKKYEEIDSYQDKVIADWLSKYGVDLEVGQKVYTIVSNNESYECPRCGGTGKIKVTTEKGEQIEVNCPDCVSNYPKGKLYRKIYSIKPKYIYNVAIIISKSKSENYKHSIKVSMQGGFATEDLIAARSMKKIIKRDLGKKCKIIKIHFLEIE